MFATIVWASDGSEAADGSLAWVARLASGQQAMLWVVHVASPSHGAAATGAVFDEAVIVKLKSQVHDLRGHGCAASLYVIRGAGVPIADAIVAAARAIEADLLVVGAGRPHRAVGGMPTAVVVRVLAAGSYPVLALPPVVSRLTPALAAAPV